MKFLLEFNQFGGDENSISLSDEIIEEIKDNLTDFLLSEVEDVLPKIKTGVLFFDLQSFDEIYCEECGENDDVYLNAVFIEKGFSFTDEQLELLKLLLSRISPNLIYTKGYKESLIITTKKLYDRIKSICKFPQALEEACQIDEDFRINKWIGFLSIEFEGTNKSNNPSSIHSYGRKSTFLSIQPYNDEGKPFSSVIEINFTPVVDNDGDDILFDVYYKIEKKKVYDISEAKKLKEILKEIKKNNDVFMYEPNSSVDSITDEIISWLAEKILPHFKNEKVKKYDDFLNILNNISQSGMEIEFDKNQLLLDLPLEIKVSYKDEYKIFQIEYNSNEDKIELSDEYDVLLEKVSPEEFEEVLFLYMIENR